MSQVGDEIEPEAPDSVVVGDEGDPVSIRQSADRDTVHRFDLGELATDLSSEVSNAASSAYEAGASTVQSGVEFVAEVGSDVADVGAAFVEESIETASEVGRALVDRIAPGLIDFLSNPGGRIAEALCSGIDTFISGTLDSLEGFDVIGTLVGSFETAIASVSGVIEQLSGGTSDMLGSLLGPLVTAIEEKGLPLLKEVQEIFASVQGTIESVWTTIGQPVADFLGEVGGGVWQGIVNIANWAWELTAPLREYAGRAWEWVKERFGIAWESTEGVRDWLVQKASEVWESVKKTLEPVMGPLKIIGGILLLLSPLGPIVVMNEVVLPLWEKIKWLWANWNTEDILVRAQDVLREDILPTVLSGITSASQAMANAASWLVDLTTQLSNAFAPLLGAVGANSCLQSVTRVVAFVGEQFTRLAEWARTGFAGLMDSVRTALNQLESFLRPILDFLVKLAQVVVNPLALPGLIASTLWQLVPDKLKPPIVTFLLELMITFVQGVSALFPGLGPFADLVKEAILGFLLRLQGMDAEAKIKATNRIAQLIGGSVEFVGGFLWGTLRGLWEGLTDPFVIIGMLVKVAVGASQYIYGLLSSAIGGRVLGEPTEQAEQPAPPAPSPSVASELGQAASQTAGLDQEWETTRSRAPSREQATPEGLFAMLSSVWDQVLAEAGKIGASIADALLDFINLPDFDIGDKLGWLAGTILFEVLLYALTAGAWAAVTAARPVLRTIVRLLDLGGEILGGLVKLLGEVRRPLMGALGVVGDFLRKIPGVGGFFDRVADALRALFRYADEAAGARRGAGEAAEETAEKTVSARRGVGDVIEEAGEEASQGAVRALPQKLAQTADGHTVRILEGGTIWLCSTCKDVTDLAHVVLKSRPTFMSDPQLVAKAIYVIRNGPNVGLNGPRLRRVLDNTAAAGEGVERVLRNLEDLVVHQPLGADQLVNDLVRGGNFGRGARWTLNYISDRRLWSKVTSLERPVYKARRLRQRKGEKVRIWDAIIGGERAGRAGMRAEFKNWSRFYPDSFIKQAAKDVDNISAGRMKWIFNQKGEIKDKETVMKMMNEALDDAVAKGKIPVEKAQIIRDSMDDFVEVASVT